MPNHGAQRIRVAEVDGAIHSAVKHVGAQKSASTRSGLGVLIPIFIGWILEKTQ
jgi:hypothetical protein